MDRRSPACSVAVGPWEQLSAGRDIVSLCTEPGLCSALSLTTQWEKHLILNEESDAKGFAQGHTAGSRALT